MKTKNQMQIHVTGKLVLRSFSNEDFDRIVSIANDYDIARQTSKLPYPLDPIGAASWLREIENDIVYAVLYDGVLVGSISVRTTDRDEAELSYWIGKQWWSQGIASRVVLFIVATLFSDYGMKRIQASHAKDNPASGRVLQKVGFVKTGPVNYYSRARGEDVPCWNYLLTKADYMFVNGE